MFESPGEGIYPIVFPDMVGHDFIASCIQSRYPGIKPTSAGFCQVNDGFVSLWGESTTLKLKSSEDDEYFLKKLFAVGD